MAQQWKHGQHEHKVSIQLYFERLAHKSCRRRISLDAKTMVKPLTYSTYRDTHTILETLIRWSAVHGSRVYFVLGIYFRLFPVFRFCSQLAVQFVSDIKTNRKKMLITDGSTSVFMLKNYMFS